MKVTEEELWRKINQVVDRLIHLGGADYDMDRTTDEESHRQGLVARDFGIEEWDWPQGVGLYGLDRLQEICGDNRYEEFLEQWFDKNFDMGLPSWNVNTTAPFLTLLELAERRDRDDYRQACRERACWVMENLPRTREGGFQHVTSAVGDRQAVRLNDGQLWIDTIFMAVLFLNKAGYLYGRQDYVDESVRQVLLHIKYLYEKKNGLFYHGWSFPRNDNFGGIFWCRGNSWFTFGIMEFLEQSRDSMNRGIYAYLADTLKAQVKTLISLQSPSGLWHTVLDDAGSYEEVSGSAGIAAGILKGVKAGILDRSCLKPAKKAIEAVCSNISEDGTVQNVSAGTGIGMNAQFYKDIMITPMAYGQSLTLAALCEAVRNTRSSSTFGW